MTAEKRKRPEPGERERQAANHLEHLEAEAAHHRNRLALYNARILTGRPASLARLEELRRISASADARLAHARTEAR
jgi:hypothetical protein